MEKRSSYRKYRPVRLICEDRNKRVYVAEHETLGIRRLIKEAKKGTDEEKRLLNEAALLSNVKSPYIPAFYDLEEDDEKVTLAEEFFDGGTLLEYLQSGKEISFEKLMSFTETLCGALEALHKGSSAYVHCDVKPSNILVCGDELRLTDFGAAVRNERSNMYEDSVGTEEYAAPEQFYGDVRSCATDVYAAGKIVDLLCDMLPLKESRKHSGVLKRLKAVLLRATEPNAGYRFESIREFLETVRCCEKGKKPMFLPGSPRTVAIAGTHHGAGATHTAVQLSSFLADENKKVALVDLSETGALTCLKKKRDGFETGPSRLRGFDLYAAADTLTAGAVRNGNYDFCIFDMGCAGGDRIHELLRCDEKFIVTDAVPWRRSRRQDIERLSCRAKTPKGWWLLINLSEHKRPEDLDRLPIRCEWMGFSPDPFEPAGQNRKLFGRTLSALMHTSKQKHGF